MAQRQRSNRGFASMDEGKQKEIASKGGKAAHAKGTAHEFDSGEAREAGRKGGLAVSQNREHMAQIGRRGGEARGAARGTPAEPSRTGGTGAGPEGDTQNGKASASATDREVGLHANALSQSGTGASSNPQNNRGTNAAASGERRPVNVQDESRDSFGNR